MIGTNGMPDQKLFIDSKDLLFLDSSIPKNIIFELIEKHRSKTIVTFDYSTHEYLEKEKIPHLSSDQFLNEDDLQQIQSRSYIFSEWFDKEIISSQIKYENINIGKLLFDEIIDYLVKFLKKFWEVKRICENKHYDSIIAPFLLCEFGNFFSNSFHALPTYPTSEFYAHDKIRINFKIGQKHFIHYISKSKYKKLKNYFEKITNFFDFSTYDPNLTQSVLVEFDTLKYKDLLLDSKSSPIQFLFYGRRRPAIWNIKSHSIIKNSNCKVITNHKLEDDQLLKNIKNGYKKIQDQLNTLWKNNDFFPSFFIFDKISFWNILLPTFVTLFNDRLESIIYEIELAKNFFFKYKIDNVLVLSEIGFIEQIIISIAKSHNIPVILIQGGLYWNTPEAYMMNKSQGAYPYLSDWFIPYGEIQKIDTLNHAKINPDKIKISACSRYNKIKSIPCEDDNYILLATTGPQPENVNGLITKNIDEYKNLIKKICEITTQHKIKLIIKQHPSPADLQIFDIVKKINPTIQIFTTGDILDLIKSCKIMISVGISSVILEAQIYQKPVLAVNGIDYKWGNHGIFQSCLFSNLEEFEKNLLELFHKKTLQNNIIQKGNAYVNNYIFNLGSGTNEILSFLNSTAKKTTIK